MKKIFTLLLIAFMVQVSFAQEAKEDMKHDDMNTIFTKENLKLTGGYLAPEIKVGNVHEDPSLLVGGKIGMIFNNRFTIGVGGYGLTNNSNFDINVGTPLQESARIGMGYGGLALEYSFFSNKAIHFTIPVLIGAGGIYVYEDDGDFFNNEWDEIENSAAFVIEPGVNVEINLFKFFRVDLGASYRMISQTDLVYITDQDLSDFTVNAAFKFGFF